MRAFPASPESGDRFQIIEVISEFFLVKRNKTGVYSLTGEGMTMRSSASVISER
jgi:hypothetical protein